MALLTALAIGSAISGLANTAWNHWQYADQKKFNSEEAEKNRTFQAEQANIDRKRADTSYQRSVADMKAAGLNPAMMFGTGSAEAVGSGTPGGSTASIGANNSGVNLGIDINSIANVLNSASNVMKASGKGTKAYKEASKIITSAAKILK